MCGRRGGNETKQQCINVWKEEIKTEQVSDPVENLSINGGQTEITVSDVLCVWIYSVMVGEWGEDIQHSNLSLKIISKHLSLQNNSMNCLLFSGHWVTSIRKPQLVPESAFKATCSWSAGQIMDQHNGPLRRWERTCVLGRMDSRYMRTVISAIGTGLGLGSCNSNSRNDLFSIPGNRFQSPFYWETATVFLSDSLASNVLQFNFTLIKSCDCKQKFAQWHVQYQRRSWIWLPVIFYLKPSRRRQNITQFFHFGINGYLKV